MAGGNNQEILKITCATPDVTYKHIIYFNDYQRPPQESDTVDQEGYDLVLNDDGTFTVDYNRNIGYSIYVIAYKEGWEHSDMAEFHHMKNA